ncbi:MAG: competence/damage-inducible protein A [Phycisphaerales bacterium JB063]
MRAILLSIGDELVLGQTVDTNAAWLSARLSRLGIRTLEHRTIDDGLDTIAQAIRETAARCELLIITGGLGPTDDDLTRPALAKAMGVELIVDPASVRALEAFFRGRGRDMPERNRVQAMHPQTSTMIDNPCGTAPGIDATLGNCRVFVTPGVPREMFGMYERSIEPALRAHGGSGRVILTTKVNTFGSGESDIAERLGPLMARDRNPVVGTTVSNGIVSVRVRAEYADVDVAQRELEATTAEVERHAGALAFGRDDATLQSALLGELLARKLTVATAESCTGGMIASMLTDVPGSSAAVLGGWVTYANAMKVSQLGVPAETIETHGAVSEPVVRAMAHGALERAGADLAVSTSGVAGPGGGTDAKPVGTVWFGLAWRDGDAVYTDARVAHFPGDRATVRERSAMCALQLLRLHVLGEDPGLLRWAKGTTT